jgi:hypothetical protein
MRTLRIFAGTALIVASVAAASPAIAQNAPPSPEALQAAHELFDIMGKDTMRPIVSQVLARSWPPIEQALRTKQPAITTDQLRDLRSEYERLVLDFFNKVMADQPAIYAKHFTAAELREMVGFYRSPVGQKSMRELPQVMAETMTQAIPKMQQMDAEIGNAFATVLKQRGL